MKVTIIDPADIESLKGALDQNNVTLFFTESPTNPFLRCVDIELVSQLCHDKGALVCVDGTFASPVNQKALTLGGDLVLHSATKFIAGHNDVLGGCISGSEELVSKICQYHHVIGGVLNPVAGDLNTRKNFVDSLNIPYLAPSFGGCESIVDQPAIMDLSGSERAAKYGMKDNLVRFSVGIEGGFEDLKADIYHSGLGQDLISVDLSCEPDRAQAVVHYASECSMR
ncbi:unnamed protein product [Musa hybrid cultivar]